MVRIACEIAQETYDKLRDYLGKMEGSALEKEVGKVVDEALNEHLDCREARTKFDEERHNP